MDNFNEVVIRYTDRNSGKSFYQTFKLTEDTADKLYDEMEAYKGGQIETDTIMFNILTACTYLSKAEGFTDTPNFDIDLPDWVKNRAKGVA